MDRQEPQRQIGWWVATIALGIGLGVAAFAWTEHLSDAGVVVAGGVDLAGIEIGGLTEAEARQAVAANAEEVLTRPIEIEFGDHQVAYLPGDLGFEYDEQATLDAAMETRRTGGALSQFWSWATTPFAEAESPVMWSFDGEVARARLAASAALTPIAAIEPRFMTNNRAELMATDGMTGSTVDLDDLIDQLADIELTAAPDHMTATLVELLPTVSDQQAAAAVSRWTEMTATGVLVSVNGRTVRLSPEHLRLRLRLSAVDGRVVAGFDLDALQEGIEAQFPEPVLAAVKPVFEIADGVFTMTQKGRPPQTCCEADSAQIVADAILSGDTTPFGTVELSARGLHDPLQRAIADGSLIVEEVSSFTTPHSCCEARVANIHRFADIVNGAYILPGEVFSLNDFVGPRTEENGFVAAGAIREGHLTDEIGGGVSQFATTFFNAAYFAGLDFAEYQSHSIYFSRYPYGREATISSPGPDLAIINTTAYPILVGTSYTETSITVSMFSTENVIVEEMEQRVTRFNLCTHVETDRKRMYPDGRVVIDTIYANYRPADGIDCHGNPIPIEGE